MKRLWWILAIAAIAAGAFFHVRRDSGRAGSPCPPQFDHGENERRSEIAAVAERRALPERTSDDDRPEADANADAEEKVEPPPSDEERRVAEEEARVAAFDALIDQWMEPAPKGVTMDDVNRFVGAFDALPANRKEECLQRALNLISDENVMLLVGILMDKRQNKELVVMVFNDILNRDETVKQPILRQVYQDKTHPCWEDVSWIFSVTGETPAEGLK